MNTTFAELNAALLKGKASDIGKRPNQEDRYDVREYQTADGRPATLAMVADGIGGHNSGEIASSKAQGMIPELLLTKPPSASETTRRLKAALEATGQAIYAESLTVPERSGMGTTCTAVVIIDRRLYLTHVGDSRAYLLRAGKLHQLTVDHTWAEEAIRAGRSPEEIKTHPNRGVIMRYLGIDPNITIDTRYRLPSGELVDGLQSGPFFLEPGDTLLLSSDGVSDALDPTFLAEHMALPDCQAAAETLVTSAVKAGATDNVTAVVVRLPGGTVVAPRAVAPVAAAQKKRALPVPLIAGAVGLLLVAVIAAVLLTRGGGGAASGAPTAVVSSATVEPGAAAQATATRRPAQTAAGGGGVAVVGSTAAPTEALPTAPALPQIDATQPVSATAPVSGTLSGEPTLVPTFTPVLTPTPRPAPTLTPRPTQSGGGPLPTQPPGRSTASTSTGGVELDGPADKEKITGTGTFSWHTAPGFSLGAGQSYELIIWSLNENPMFDGRSPVGAGPKTSHTVNLTDSESVLHITDGGTYKWGVRLVAGVQPVRMLSVERVFTYAKVSSGGGGGTEPGCTGPDC